MEPMQSTEPTEPTLCYNYLCKKRILGYGFPIKHYWDCFVNAGYQEPMEEEGVLCRRCFKEELFGELTRAF